MNLCVNILFVVVNITNQEDVWVVKLRLNYRRCVSSFLDLVIKQKCYYSPLFSSDNYQVTASTATLVVKPRIKLIKQVFIRLLTVSLALELTFCFKMNFVCLTFAVVFIFSSASSAPLDVDYNEIAKKILAGFVIPESEVGIVAHNKNFGHPSGSYSYNASQGVLYEIHLKEIVNVTNGRPDAIADRYKMNVLINLGILEMDYMAYYRRDWPVEEHIPRIIKVKTKAVMHQLVMIETVFDNKNREVVGLSVKPKQTNYVSKSNCRDNEPGVCDGLMVSLNEHFNQLMPWLINFQIIGRLSGKHF